MQNMSGKNNRIIHNKNNRKGQAALEFLVTYGWAIMATIIAVGALSYFGVFNTQKYIRDVCYFGDQLACEDNVAYTTGRVKFQLRNNLGADINITSVIIKSDYGVSACVANTGVIAGNVFEVNCTPASKLTNNAKFKYSSVITFERTGSVNLHNQTGDVTTTVRS